MRIIGPMKEEVTKP